MVTYCYFEVYFNQIWFYRIYTPIFSNGRDTTCSWNRDGGRRWTNWFQEPIGWENHRICAHNCVCTFDFFPRIWSWPHDKDCLYVLSSSRISFSRIVTSRDSTLSLLISTSRNSLTLPVSKTQFNTRNIGADTFCNLFLSSFGFLVLFTNPSARAGYDTRSIFKRSLTGFEFRVFLLLD